MRGMQWRIRSGLNFLLVDFLYGLLVLDLYVRMPALYAQPIYYQSTCPFRPDLALERSAEPGALVPLERECLPATLACLHASPYCTLLLQSVCPPGPTLGYVDVSASFPLL